jgi:predicted  nucleic acid-binding Zn-ribbon protein
MSHESASAGLSIRALTARFLLLALLGLVGAAEDGTCQGDGICQEPLGKAVEGRVLLQVQGLSDVKGSNTVKLVGEGMDYGDLAGRENSTGSGSAGGKGEGAGSGAGAGTGGTNSSTWSWQKMKTMSAQYAAHRVLLRRALVALKATMQPENEEVDETMSEIVDQQASNQDKCPMQLAEAQKHLKTLHQNIVDLGTEVNATEAQIQSTTDSLNNIHTQISATNDALDDALAKCTSQEQELEKQLAELKSELEQMQQLGREGFKDTSSQLDVSKRIVGLFQEASARPTAASMPRGRRTGKKPISVADAKARVGKTKTLAKNLASCLAQQKPKPVAALDQVSPSNYQTFPQQSGQQAGAFPQATSGQGVLPPEHFIAPGCKGDVKIQVKLGGILQTITPGQDLKNGMTASQACANVNSLYAVGDIQMECQNGYIHVDLSQCKIKEAPSSQQCHDEAEELRKEFEEAVKSITEQISEVEDEIASTACEDTANQQHQQQLVPLQQQQQTLSTTLNTLTGQLSSFRSRIDSAVDAEQKLRDEITTIARRCEAAEKIVEEVDKVRDAIHILDLCPGLGHLEFTLPEWVGTWVVLDVKDDLYDAQIDAEMYTMCRGLSSGGGIPRPAETSEIQQGSVTGAPETNTASVPLMGTCPGCEGILDSESGVTHPNGHARICWDQDSPLTTAGKREDCGHGRKALMCVLDTSTASTPTPS